MATKEKKSKKIQKISFVKQKAGPALGYRTTQSFKKSRFGGKKGGPSVKFNPAQFKTQHKG